MAVTKKRFLIHMTVVFALSVGGGAGFEYYRKHTIDWEDHLVHAFFLVGFILLFGYLLGDITFKKKGDAK